VCLDVFSRKSCPLEMLLMSSVCSIMSCWMVEMSSFALVMFWLTSVRAACCSVMNSASSVLMVWVVVIFFFFVALECLYLSNWLIVILSLVLVGLLLGDLVGVVMVGISSGSVTLIWVDVVVGGFGLHRWHSMDVLKFN
jgi:hypothetical protein